MANERSRAQMRALISLAGGSLTWLGLAFLLVSLSLALTIRVGRVTGEEVGVLLNRINGETTVINQSGVRIYNGITHDFYVLDKTLQTLDMTELVGHGDREEKDDLKIKTVDGSDVYVDLKVQYNIIPEMADVVLRSSGTGDAYKEKWARDYVRSVTRNCLGELTTEDFYDSSQRGLKVQKAKVAINGRLQPFGIEIDSLVIPRKPHFYEEYEEMIKKKKLADQGVLEEQSKALAAKQRQETAIVEETNITNVAVETYEGEMRQLVIKAEAEAEKAQKEADAYYETVTIGAGATLYEMSQSADGILATKKAEAEGLTALGEALEGEGGRNMVKMAYAEKLADMTISGQPFTRQSNIERFEHLKGALTAGTGPAAQRPAAAQPQPKAPSTAGQPAKGGVE